MLVLTQRSERRETGRTVYCSMSERQTRSILVDEAPLCESRATRSDVGGRLHLPFPSRARFEEASDACTVMVLSEPGRPVLGQAYSRQQLLRDVGVGSFVNPTQSTITAEVQVAIQSGVFPLGRVAGVGRKFTLHADIGFPTPFAGVPVVTANALQDAAFGEIADTFSVTISRVSPDGFSVNVVRVDTMPDMLLLGADAGWGQQLQLAWIAHE